MEEIIKTLLLEGIDEDTIHRVLDVIEEAYEVVEGLTTNYLGTQSGHGSVDAEANRTKPKTHEIQVINDKRVSVKRPEEQVRAEEEEHEEKFKDLYDKAVDLKSKAAANKINVKPEDLKFYPKNVNPYSAKNPHEETKNKGGEKEHKRVQSGRAHDKLLKKVYKKDLERLQGLVQEIKNQKKTSVNK